MLLYNKVRELLAGRTSVSPVCGSDIVGPDIWSSSQPHDGPSTTHDHGKGLQSLGNWIWPVDRGVNVTGYAYEATRYIVFPLVTRVCPNPDVRKHLYHVIRALKARTRSIESQVAVAHWLGEHDQGPQSDGVKRSTIEDAIGGVLDHTVRTSLEHLEDIGLVHSFLTTDTTFVIAEWHSDVFIMGQVDDAAKEGIEALIDDFDDYAATEDPAVAADGAGTTLRQVVADRFDLHPTAVEDHLRSGDPVERLNAAVGAIQESDEHEVSDGYGEITFRNPAYRYRLTEAGWRLYQR